jgi:DNA-binding HxlR family transcriptional regulator
MCDPLHYPIDDSVKLLGKRWAAPVLLEIMSGRDQFSTLMHVISGVNSKTLSTRLDEFEQSGLIERRRHNGSRPEQVHYILTPKGENMRELIREIVSFTMKWQLA